MIITVREYVSADYERCRDLWRELTVHHRELYEDLTIGGDDPGAGFDTYLREEARVQSWVASSGDVVVGLCGLFDHGHSGEIEPVVVAHDHRGKGIGRQLVEHAVAAARDRHFEYVALRPVARNVAALQSFYALGFRTLGGRIDLTMDLSERRHQWRQGNPLFGLDVEY